MLASCCCVTAVPCDDCMDCPPSISATVSGISLVYRDFCEGGTVDFPIDLPDHNAQLTKDPGSSCLYTASAGQELYLPCIHQFRDTNDCDLVNPVAFPNGYGLLFNFSANICTNPQGWFIDVIGMFTDDHNCAFTGITGSYFQIVYQGASAICPPTGVYSLFSTDCFDPPCLGQSTTGFFIDSPGTCTVT